MIVTVPVETPEVTAAPFIAVPLITVTPATASTSLECATELMAATRAIALAVALAEGEWPSATATGTVVPLMMRSPLPAAATVGMLRVISNDAVSLAAQSVAVFAPEVWEVSVKVPAPSVSAVLVNVMTLLVLDVLPVKLI